MRHAVVDVALERPGERVDGSWARAAGEGGVEFAKQSATTRSTRAALSPK
jgi:hypothetical protein